MINTKQLFTENTYIVAVSGGVDSVVLLHMLNEHKYDNLVVAHINHGIRKESYKDEELVKDLAIKYNYPFKVIKLNLGEDTNETMARLERYNSLIKIQKEYSAQAIITAHHQDDVIETCFINIIRGTGRSGVSSLQSTKYKIRPLLHVPKKDIYNYAKNNNLQWNEDITNQDLTILRNKLRHKVLPKISQKDRKNLLNLIAQTEYKNRQIDNELQTLLYKGLHKGKPVLSRGLFVTLPHDIASEIIRLLLIQNGAIDVDRHTIERVVVGIKTKPQGKQLQASGVDVLLTKRSARFKKRSQTDKKLV